MQYRISEYAIQNRIRICYTEYQNIYSYMQYKITQIFHAAFLCTDYAIYIIDVQNIWNTTPRILVNILCNVHNIHIKNTQYSNRQILEFTKHIISENGIWNTKIFSTKDIKISNFSKVIFTFRLSCSRTIKLWTMHLFLVLHSTLMPHWTCHTKNLNACPHTCSEFYSNWRIKQFGNYATPVVPKHCIDGSEGKGFFLHNFVHKKIRVGHMRCSVQWV